MKKRIKLLILLPLICLITSCSYIFDMLLDFNNTSYSTTSNNNKPASSVNIIEDYDYISPLQEKMENDDDFSVGMPSSGDIKVLVIPVQIGNVFFTDNDLKRIDLAFNGNRDSTGFESVNSYYKKTSGGLLNIEATITSVYKTPNNKLYYESLYSRGGNPEYEIINGAMHYFNETYNYDEFDYNKDSYIDGIYLIYSCDYSYEDDSPWWAWCYEYYTSDYEYYDNVEVDFYVWASVDFLTDEITYNHRISANAETLIHETGHMLGLDDYYDYNYDLGPDGGIGGGCMMDYNVGDHDPFSKIMMGWSTPTIIKDDITINLKPSVTSNESLIIPLREFDGDYFDEYLVIDYFTNESLNFVQAGHNGLFSKNGIRIYHVDARIDKNLGNPNRTGTDKFGNSYYNTIFSFNNSDTDHKQIRLIEKDNNNSIVNTEFSSNDDLFYKGDFLENFTNYDDEKVEFILTIDEITKEYATITITFKKEEQNSN